MQLAHEDNLRLHVLFAQSVQAVRINEGTMTLHALTTKGEATIKLNPTVRDEQYLRWIREWLSLKVTGSPGGYPVFLQRWTRTGHAHNNLEHMLLLGEPEAIVAVVHSPNLSHELAKYAWWANPSADTARRLLEKSAVAEGELGKELATYLLEFLPFEEIALDVVDTVRLCLQGELIVAAEREQLWSRAKRKNPFYVGFLHADAKHIPLNTQAHPHFNLVNSALQTLLADNNPFANALHHTLSADGQKWLQTLLLALEKPTDQEVVISLFRAIQKRFNLPFPEVRGVDMDLALQRANQYCQGIETPEVLQVVLDTLPSELHPTMNHLLVLAQLGEDSLNKMFGGSDAVGSVMRKHLEPLVKVIVDRVGVLLGGR
ncbi:hypothetical protein [uncultured Thiothrix sp.]|uniref:hypothetical protein n=1 Tax=uncultured Thiothrix sp. TaxID=223185 RepID=UPI00262B9869|nr:hypothetical protein [uncultured Thiothrix sp.]HMT94028.1 hypothetical protein [Thiolinea sp.]